MPGDDARVGIRVVKYVVYLMRLAAIATSVLVIACYFFLIKQTVQGDGVILAKIMNVLSDTFYVGFCVGVLLTELELSFFLFEFSFMYTWPGRGVAQIFIAVDFLNSKENIKAQGLDSDTQNLITEIAGYALLVVGVLYVLMGVLCIRRLTDTSEKQRAQRKEFETRLHSHKKSTKQTNSEEDGENKKKDDADASDEQALGHIDHTDQDYDDELYMISQNTEDIQENASPASVDYTAYEEGSDSPASPVSSSEKKKKTKLSPKKDTKTIKKKKPRR
eukprot:TRINITY_DN14814_c0_g1_i1.p1 TRINITY_DN14814_c0_g1~~TRINITY_DN14814_c0_g1_i1.p1  ORF type:complete len:276 (+),score=66.12 TRINITY_DN14814_c0_g1_i1:111-938(+)